MDISQILNNVLQAVLVAVVPLIATWLLKLLSVTVKNKYLQIALQEVYDAVETIGQTVVDDMKSDGTWTKEEEGKALALAKQTALTSMGNLTRKILGIAVGDIDVWMTSKIESYLHS